jgi:hypothetical protein
MEHAYESTTVEMDKSGYSDLESKLLDNKGNKPHQDADIREKESSNEKKKASQPSKKYTFRKGDQALELDDDFEIEMTADKRPVRLTLRELKDRAAGDIAVKNRMHSLAEEKKRVQSTFKQFADLAKKDPLGALEFISKQANAADSDFEYNNYIQKLAEQAEKLGQMDEKERKAWELEKKLTKAEEDLSRRERKEAVVLRKQQMIADYPGIGDSEFGQMVDAVLSNEELLDGIEDEHGVMDKVEELIQETLTQRDIMSVIGEYNSDYLNDNNLIFSLSDQLRQNPDLDEEDVRDIIRELIAPAQKARAPQLTDRERDIRTLSTKQRQAMPVSRMREQSAEPFDLLKQQLLEKRDEIRKTPLNKR